MVLSCDNNDAFYHAKLGFQDRGQFLIFVFFQYIQKVLVQSLSERYHSLRCKPQSLTETAKKDKRSII